MEDYRDRRSRERSRDRHFPTRAPGGDSYIPYESRSSRGRSTSPSTYRKVRSRSPLSRQQGDTWRGSARPRSPQSRRYEDKDNGYTSRAETYRRRDCDDGSVKADDEGKEFKSSLLLKRTREFSPHGSTKKERLDSPAKGYPRPRSPVRTYPTDRTYRPRSRSRPRRNDQSDSQKPDIQRRLSPSTHRGEFRFAGTSSRESHHSISRMSSPRGFSRRNIDGHDGSLARPRPNDGHRSPRAERSPPTARTHSPIHSQANSSISSRENVHDNGHQHRDVNANPHTASRERVPPSGPSSTRAANMTSISGGNGLISQQHLTSTGRNISTGAIGAPAQPRDEFSSRSFNSPRGRGSRGDLSTSRRGASTWGSGPSGRPGLARGSMPGREIDTHGPPSGPRSSILHREVYSSHSSQPTFARGSSSSTSTSYPKTQRFNQSSSSNASQQYLSGTPTIKEGEGERLLPLFDNTKAEKLEEEAARLRKTIDERELAKRIGLREWDRLERESDSAALKSDLAEKHLRSLSGEGDGVGAF